MSSSTPAATIGLLLGSLRQNGNNAGLAAWLTAIAQRVLSAAATADKPEAAATSCTVQQIFPFPAPSTEAEPAALSHSRYPGPVLEPYMAAAVRSSSDYPSPVLQRWSAAVRACAAFVVVTPQYNWGVPGELKNALDALYHEWTGRPFLVVAYGGHGGDKCDEQLRLVMGGGLKMREVGEKVRVVLPREYISGDRRVGDGGDDSFLDQYEPALVKAISALAGMLQPAAVDTIAAVTR